MNDEILPEYTEALIERQDLENQWLQIIEQRVNELLEKEPGLLFSHLYRLDVEESVLNHILKHEAPSNFSKAISLEILKRQKARVISKKNNPQNLFLDEDF
jgi:hypothetical protein